MLVSNSRAATLLTVPMLGVNVAVCGSVSRDGWLTSSLAVPLRTPLDWRVVREVCGDRETSPELRAHATPGRRERVPWCMDNESW